jgi:CRISPR-associated endonuclease Csn1
MSHTTLGLDLGPNSIGWALIDQDRDCVINCGVRHFPEGVDAFDTKKEKPRNEARRAARGMRRQNRRRGARKRGLRSELIRVGLWPEEPAEQEALLRRDPLALRVRALEEPLTAHEIGRALLHLNQRRGFLSNRKKERKTPEVKGMLAEINTLAADIQQTGCRSTLGEYLYRKAASLNHCHRTENDHVRRRHTLRQMLVDEFDQIWTCQQRHHPDLLSDKLRFGVKGPQKQPHKPVRRGQSHTLVDAFGLEGFLFFQRTMYWPRSVVGKCELEPKEKRCPRADRRAQRFRILQELNNLRYIDPITYEEQSLDDDQRNLVLEKLSTRKEMTFEAMKKALGFMETVQFNLESGKRTKILGMVSDYALANKNAMGPAWHKLPENVKNAVVELLAVSTDDDETFERLVHVQGLTPEQADGALSADLPAGYVKLSLKAIEKLLIHLERKLPLMGNDESDSAMHAAGYMRRDQLQRRVFDQLPDLARVGDARVGDIPSPVVKRAIVELRKVVNAIIREYGKPDAIHVEMARDLRQGPKARSEYSHRIREIEVKRSRAADEIRALRDQGVNVRLNRDTIQQYLFWQEQDHSCMYCQGKISQAQLFGGEVDVDHILPYSRSLDDSQMNKVVCHRHCNADKTNQTPHEWLAPRDPARFERVCQHALSLVRGGLLPYKKYRRIIQKELKLDDFIARQLTSTAYIARATVEYLKCLFAQDHSVLGLKGELTAELRHQWGIDNLLSTLPDSPAWQAQNELRPGEKNRADHRHHAIDAIVIALTDRSRLQQLSRIRKAGGTLRTGEVLPFPWETFRDDVVDKVSRINVSHRAERKVAGALHEETAYGPTRDADVFVVRKPLDALSPNEVPLIRDAVIRSIIEERLKNHGIEVGRATKKVDARRWRAAMANVTMPSGVPIRKVRVLRKEKTIQPIRGGSVHEAYVKPGSTHHLALFEWEEGGERKRSVDFVTMLRATDRVKTQRQEFRRLVTQYQEAEQEKIRKRSSQYRERQRQAERVAPLIDRNPPSNHATIPESAKFLYSLSRGEMVWANWKGQHKLLVFKTAASTQGQIYFAEHTDARRSAEQTQFVARANKLDARKVTVDPLGRIRWAND